MFRTRYSRLLLATCLALFCAAPARSDDTAADSTATPDWGPLRPHAGALLFQLGSDLTVGSFDGATISYKTHRSASSAWRYGLTINANATGIDNDNRRNVADTTQSQQTDDIHVNGTSLGLSAHYLRYMAPVERVSFYLGGGPEVNWSHSRQERTSTFSAPGGSPLGLTSEDTRDTWSAGLGGRLGVEWFCARRISLVGEYLCSVSYFQDNLKSINDDTSGGTHDERSSDADGFRLTSQGARAGVSVYFR